MCGPTASEKQLESQQQAFSQEVQQNYGKLFGEQQAVMQNLNNIETPIAEAGPSQQGWSPAEVAAVNTGILDTTGANYAAAQRAAQTLGAGRTGNSGLESGVQQQISAGIASQAAGATSAEELGATEANYAQGRQNWATATGGLQALSGQYNPVATAGAGTQANQAGFQEAQTIQQQQGQALGMIGGLVGSGLGALSGGLGNLDTTGGSSGGEQALNFLGGL
jgi:hypothetical protein